MTTKPTLKITLTPEQQAQIKQQTGRELKALRLEALEARLAPGFRMN